VNVWKKEEEEEDEALGMAGWVGSGSEAGQGRPGCKQRGLEL
jgi:hypothetical protein